MIRDGDAAAPGIGRDRLTAVGYGASRPVAPNDTEAGKALNRRIEMVVKEAGSLRGTLPCLVNEHHFLKTNEK